MSILHPSCFPGKIHFDIKDHMARGFSPSNGNRIARFQDLKSNSNISHFFCNSISPICIAITFINLLCMLDRCWDFNTIFVTRFLHSRVHSRNNAISFPQCKRYPPRESRFILNLTSLCKFGYINRIGFLQ